MDARGCQTDITKCGYLRISSNNTWIEFDGRIALKNTSTILCGDNEPKNGGELRICLRCAKKLGYIW